MGGGAKFGVEEGKKQKEAERKTKQEFSSISDRYKGPKFHEMEKGGLGSFGVVKSKEKKQSV